MAKSDETARRIYKQLIQLHTECSDILKLVKESGALSREIKDLEEQVKSVIYVQASLICSTFSFVIGRN